MKTSNLLHTAIWAVSLQLLLGFPTHCAATVQQENSAASSAQEHLPEWLRQTFHQHSPVPTYVERFQGLSRMFSQARDLTSLDEEQRHRFQLQLHDAVTNLLSLSPEAVREAVLRSVEGFSSQGPGDIRNGSAGRLEAEYTVSELCLNHTVAIVKGLVEKDYWAIQRESFFMFVMRLVDKDYWAIQRESFFIFVKGLIEKDYWAIQPESLFMFVMGLVDKNFWTI